MKSACETLRNINAGNHLEHKYATDIKNLTYKLANRKITAASHAKNRFLYSLRTLFKGIANLFHCRIGTDNLINNVTKTINSTFRQDVSYHDYRAMIAQCIDAFNAKENPTEEEIEKFKYTLTTIEKFKYTLTTIEKFFINVRDNNRNDLNILQDAYNSAADKNDFLENAFNPNDDSKEMRVIRILHVHVNLADSSDSDSSIFTSGDDEISHLNSVTQSEASEIELTCPITFEPYANDAVILIEDGFTYSQSALIQWLATNPDKSPTTGQNLTSTAFYPNRAVNRNDRVCPITKEPLVEAYFCKEDGQTYEKAAIIRYCREQALAGRRWLRSPITGISSTSFTLYPNKILFTGNIPATQEPLVLEVASLMDLNEPQPRCIYDEDIRHLIIQYMEASPDVQRALYTRIHQRRERLGLSVTIDETWRTLDLSELDLSNMNIKGLGLKGGTLKGTSFENSTFIKCDFSKCFFVRCNMSRTIFNSCTFVGEETSFHKTILSALTIFNDCEIEQGASWRSIHSSQRELFKEELRLRGALNSNIIESL